MPIVPPPDPVGSFGFAPAGANPNDPTGAGGGTIGTGVAPGPQEQGFTGNAQQQGTPQPPQAAMQ